MKKATDLPDAGKPPDLLALRHAARAALLGAAEPGDIARVLKKLRDMALAGNVDAARAYLEAVAPPPAG
jgi:hypothetical protein